MALPYHLERSRPGAPHVADMLSANLGRTLRSMRQAVLDARDVIHWLKTEGGYREVAVLGISLGSWIAGLVAAYDEAVSKAALLLPGDSLADMVWTGRATRHIRAGLQAEMSHDDLRRAWKPLDLTIHAPKLARPGLALQLVVAKRDKVVSPGLARNLAQSLHHCGATPRLKEFNCGHYSLGLPQYALRVGHELMGFLTGDGQPVRRANSR